MNDKFQQYWLIRKIGKFNVLSTQNLRKLNEKLFETYLMKIYIYILVKNERNESFWQYKTTQKCQKM